MNILYIATPLHLGESLGLIEQWGLNISDTAPPEHSFIISHVQSVIRPRGGPWMVDFELPPVYCSPAPAVRLSTVPTRSHPTSYSCGRTVIMTVWTLSAGSVCVHVCVMAWAVVPPRPAQQQSSASAGGGGHIKEYKIQRCWCSAGTISLQQQEQGLKCTQVQYRVQCFQRYWIYWI